MYLVFYLRRFILLVGLWGISACSEKDSGTQNQPERLRSNWKIEDVRLECGDYDCPRAVGVYIVIEESPTGIRAQRCTASLLSNSRILTNSHCDEPGEENFKPTRSYFVLRVGTQTIVRSIKAKLFSIHDKLSGIGRDLAIHQLQEPFSGVEPLKISRSVPSDLETLVSYVVNEKAHSNFTRFVVDKKVCTTRPHVPVFWGGVSDDSVGLSLYGCEIIRGNSGSPVFTQSNLFEIQGVLNTVWNFVNQPSGGPSTEVDQLASLFFEKPEFLKATYAMAERVHCLPVPGESDTLKSCAPLAIENSTSAPFRDSFNQVIDNWFANQAETELGIWTVVPFSLRVFDLDRRSPAFLRPGTLLVPVLGCLHPLARKNLSRGRTLTESRRFEFYRMGMSPTGKVSSHLAQVSSLEATLVKDDPARVSISFSGLTLSELMASNAPYEISRDDLALASSRVTNQSSEVPKCIESSVQTLYQEALRLGSELFAPAVLLPFMESDEDILKDRASIRL